MESSSVTGGCFAAIDIGTNSCRLIIIRPGQGTLVRVSEITRLGEGVNKTRTLSEKAMQRTLNVLQQYGEVIKRNSVQGLRISSTSACRDASNRSQFFDRAQAILGTRPEILSGEEEGQLSFKGAVSALTSLQGNSSLKLVFDLGGGSTELCIGRQGATHTMSVDVGCVRVQELFLQADRPSRQDLEQAELFAKTEIEKDLQRNGIAELISKVDVVVGVAGTMTTIAAINCKLEQYDPARIHGHKLEKEAFVKIYQKLADLTTEERKLVPGMEARRADVILGGCAVFAGLVRLLPVDSILISEGDILDALASSCAETY